MSNEYHLRSAAANVVLTALIVAFTAVLIGTAVAVFLWSLDLVTQTRFAHPWLLWTLPLLGGAVGLLYDRVGRDAERGNNLIIEQIHRPGGGSLGGGVLGDEGGRVPRRMAPLVLLGTLLTHLGGGSAGREGTAVQMGGSIAAGVCRTFKLPPATMRVLLMAGVAAGFGAVFGTPLAGAVFAIEVLAIGRMSYAALGPCLLAAIVGDRVCVAWNVQWLGLHFQVHHTHYALQSLGQDAGPAQVLLIAKIAVAAMLFGLASVLFTEMTHGIAAGSKRWIKSPALRPVIGGAFVIALVFGVGSRDYLGLGVTADPHAGALNHGVSIVSSFQPGGATAWSWLWKTIFTAVTLGSGFKGGEVTPLFFIGSTLGHALAGPLGVPVDLLAALGFVAVFAGATKTPLACTIMGIELFGSGTGSAGLVVYLAVACWVAFACSGRRGIYSSQLPREDCLNPERVDLSTDEHR